MSRSLVAILALLIGLGVGSTARADQKFDWGPYLEAPGARPLPVKSTPGVATPATPKKATASRTASKPRAAKQAVKPKRKAR